MKSKIKNVIHNPHSRWAIGAFVRFLNNGPTFTDLVDAFPESQRPHMKRKLVSILADSIKNKGSYVDNVIDFYNYLDKKNKWYFLNFIQQWADDRDGQPFSRATAASYQAALQVQLQDSTDKVEPDNAHRQLQMFVDDLFTP